MQNHTQKEATIEMFRLLSEFYKYPNQEFYEYVSTEDIQKELRNLVKQAGLNFEIQIYKPFVSYEEMTRAYTNTFVGIDKQAASPVESVYKVWTTDNTATMAFAKSKGYLMGDAALHIQHLLDQFQMQLPEELGKKPDHISVLLELLAYILENQGEQQTVQFLEDHFDWLEDFQLAIKNVQGHEFYMNVTELLIEIIDETKKTLRTNSEQAQ